jgi:hypothetical protein
MPCECKMELLHGNSEKFRAVLIVVNVTVLPRGKSQNTTWSSENSVHRDTRAARAKIVITNLLPSSSAPQCDAVVKVNSGLHLNTDASRVPFPHSGSCFQNSHVICYDVRTMLF